MIDKIEHIVKKVLKEATGEGSGSRGSFVTPLRPGKRIFDKSQLGPFDTAVSDYYNQELAVDSYDGEMSTPKKNIKKIESKAKQSSIYAKNHPVRNDDDGDVINPFPGHSIKRPPKNELLQPFTQQVNEWHYEEYPILTEDLNILYGIIDENSTSTTSGPYNGPIEVGMKKWGNKTLSPFTEFVNSDINKQKVKSTLKNNVKRTVGVWEKDTEDIDMDTHDVHAINEDLAVWFGTKKKPKGSSQPKGPWVNICRKVDGKHPPCGRSEGDTKGYPKCRAAGVAGKMSDSAKKAACAQKRRAEKKDPKTGTGNKPTMTSYKPKK
jgi:hypothetical protein